MCENRCINDKEALLGRVCGLGGCCANVSNWWREVGRCPIPNLLGSRAQSGVQRAAITVSHVSNLVYHSYTIASDDILSSHTLGLARWGLNLFFFFFFTKTSRGEGVTAPSPPLLTSPSPWWEVFAGTVCVCELGGYTSGYDNARGRFASFTWDLLLGPGPRAIWQRVLKMGKLGTVVLTPSSPT